MGLGQACLSQHFRQEEREAARLTQDSVVHEEGSNDTISLTSGGEISSRLCKGRAYLLCLDGAETATVLLSKLPSNELR